MKTRWGRCNGGGPDNTTDIPLLGTLVYTMDPPMVGVLVYTHGHSNDGSPGLHSWTLHFMGPDIHHGHRSGGGPWFTPWTLQWQGSWFTLTDTSMMGPGGSTGPWTIAG